MQIPLRVTAGGNWIFFNIVVIKRHYLIKALVAVDAKYYLPDQGR